MKIDKQSVITPALKPPHSVGMSKQAPGGTVRSSSLFTWYWLNVPQGTASIPEVQSERDTKNSGNVLSLNSTGIRKQDVCKQVRAIIGSKEEKAKR